MQADLIEKLESEGYRARVVSSAHVDELWENIQGRLKEGSLKQEVFEMYKQVMVPSPPKDLPNHRSVIVMAVPQPQIRFVFTLEGRRFPAIVPPTYLHGRAVDKRTKDSLDDFLGTRGYRAVTAFLPRKLLAVRSGLAEYGRNNITYVAGLGSFHRIGAFYSDMPCEEETWREPVMMSRCETCTACATGCPMGAIDEDSFPIRAEKCLTFHNEQPHAVAFPGYIDPTWHNCLVGCLICQRACPEDRDVIDWTEDSVSFTEEETRFLLALVPPDSGELWTPEGPRVPDNIPGPLVAKLEEADLIGLLEVIPRNLRALVEVNGYG